MSSANSFSTQVIKSFLYSGAGNTFSKIINVIGLFVVLKLISPEAFGIASIVLAIFAVVLAVTEMGLGVAIVQANSLKKREIDSLFWLSLMLTGVLYGVIFLLAPFAAQFYEEPLITPLVRVHGIIVVFFTFYFVPRNLLKRELFFKELAIIDNVALLASTVIMVTLGYMGYGAWAIIGGEVGNRLGQLILSHAYKPFWPRFQFNWEEVKDRVYFGLYATGSRLLYNLYSNADYLIVGKIFGTQAVGIYTLAYRIVTDTVKTLTSNLNEVAYPAFSRLQDDLKRLQLYFFTLARGSLQLNSIILIIIALFVDDILLFTGYNEWLDAVPLVQLLAASAVLRTVSPLVPQLLNAVGEAKLNFYYSLSNAIIMPLAFLVGAQFGLLGVGWSWVIGYPVVVLLLFYFGSKKIELSLFTFIRRAFSGFWLLPVLLLMGLGIQYGLKFLFEGESIFVPILGVPIVLALGLFIVYTKEKETIALLRGKIKKLPSDTE
ncbi:MAG: lipopolysaccharide biosynthesis protein [Balneola sp.]